MRRGACGGTRMIGQGESRRELGEGEDCGEGRKRSARRRVEQPGGGQPWTANPCCAVCVSVVTDTARRAGRLCKMPFAPCTAAHHLLPRA